jgi:hypothetical protein
LRQLGAGAGQDGQELLAAVADQEVRGADAGAQPPRDVGQDPVADVVAELIVHVLEVIDVDERHRQRLAAPLGCLHRPGQVLVQELAVVGLGQRIGHRQPPQARVVDVERDGGGDEAEDLEVVHGEGARAHRGHGHDADARVAVGDGHAGERADAALGFGMHLVARVERDVVDERRLAPLRHPAGHALAEPERHAGQVVARQPGGRLAEQALAVVVEQHDRAGIGADLLAHEV